MQNEKVILRTGLPPASHLTGEPVGQKVYFSGQPGVRPLNRFGL